MVVPGLHDPGIRLRVKDVEGAAELPEARDALEELSGAGLRIVALCHLIPLQVPAVEIPGVIPLERIIVIGVVIELADLVSGVEDRDAALGEQEGVEHEIQPDRALQLLVVALVLRRLNAAQRRRRAAQSRIAELRIVVVELAPGIAAVPGAFQVVV